MRLNFLPDLVLRAAAIALVWTALSAARAQTPDLLYDPEPPANSAYVRVLQVIAGTATGDLWIDGKPRRRNLANGQASDYLVLPAGHHRFALYHAGKAIEGAILPLDIDSGRAITVVFSGTRDLAKPLVFEDKANANMLKAVLAVYHLDAKAGPLDVLTADGKTKVFSNIRYGTSSQLSVNPVTIELMAARVGDSVALARAPVAMAPGGTYSFLVLPGEAGKVVIQAFQNKVERFTGTATSR
ncbi:MAG: alginate O-acetyltransferase AlgF [Rhodoferax sp.]|nr:alginate O-acetyltransferase AlgF [Rhodoferax sp.]